MGKIVQKICNNYELLFDDIYNPILFYNTSFMKVKEIFHDGKSRKVQQKIYFQLYEVSVYVQ